MEASFVFHCSKVVVTLSVNSLYSEVSLEKYTKALNVKFYDYFLSLKF